MSVSALASVLCGAEVMIFTGHETARSLVEVKKRHLEEAQASLALLREELCAWKGECCAMGATKI